jgi:hypothetical protein
MRPGAVAHLVSEVAGPDAIVSRGASSDHWTIRHTSAPEREGAALTPQTLTRAPRSRPAVGRIARSVPAVIGGVVVILLLSWLVRGPDFVDRVTIANRTAFDVDVNVAGADGSRLDLTYVTAGETKAVRDVIDKGDVWIFHFSYGRTDAGTLRLDRTRLTQSGWRVEIPAAVEDRLDEAGHEPPP